MRHPSSWHTVFLRMAQAIAERSKDPSTQHGAVVVDAAHGQVSSGFNGPPARIDDTLVDWTRPAKYAYIIHAEENAIMRALAARGLMGLADCTLYVTGPPCASCALRIAAAGLRRVVIGPRCWASRTQADADTAARIYLLAGIEVVEWNIGV